MKYLETEEKKNHLQSHQLFCDSICSVLLLRLTSRSPPENGIAINFGTTEFGSATFNRQNPSICTNSNCKQTAASNQDILSQDIEAVVIKQTKKTQP
jgi:hypothetical protein